jgi:hypothetical protein
MSKEAWFAQYERCLNELLDDGEPDNELTESLASDMAMEAVIDIAAETADRLLDESREPEL